MLEVMLLNYLKTALSPVAVYPEKPETVPAKMVLFERTGGGEENLISHATVAIQSYAPSMLEAAQLNEQVITAMRACAVSCSNISKCTLETSYNYTDTTRKGYRYQAVYDIVYHNL